jgi:hypothetical protein
MAKPEIYGVHGVILCNEARTPMRATVCFNQNDGQLYVHLDGAHGEFVTVKPHEQKLAAVNVIPRAAESTAHT